jgi:hypothetical protein
MHQSSYTARTHTREGMMAVTGLPQQSTGFAFVLNSTRQFRRKVQVTGIRSGTDQ